MESSPSKSQHKRSESQQISFERSLDEDMSAYKQENRRNSTSIIYDPTLTPWIVRCNDLAVQEIRSERSDDDASASGEIQGRKLDFDDDEEEQEVRSLGSSVSDGQDSSFLNSSPCLSDEKKVDLEEEVKNCPSLCDENIKKRVDLVEIANHVDQEEEKKSGDFGANLEEKNDEGIDSTCFLASPCMLLDEEIEKSGDFGANMEDKNGGGIDPTCFLASPMFLDEEIKKSGDFDVTLEEKRRGRCGVSRAWFVVLILGVTMVLMGFSFGKFGGNEVFLVPT